MQNSRAWSEIFANLLLNLIKSQNWWLQIFHLKKIIIFHIHNKNPHINWKSSEPIFFFFQIFQHSLIIEWWNISLCIIPHGLLKLPMPLSYTCIQWVLNTVELYAHKLNSLIIDSTLLITTISIPIVLDQKEANDK